MRKPNDSLPTSPYTEAQRAFIAEPKTWPITGVAGFIGSHLLETLLKLNQRVMGLDNFITGHRRNLDQVRASVSDNAWSRFRFIEGTMRDANVCRQACAGVNYVLHHAALGSVPRSLGDPLGYHQNNVTGFLNMIMAARDAHVKRFVYASSSAVYGDSEGLPKVEDRIGRPLSPYAATKIMNETYAAVFARSYGFRSIGFRYFNVFGPRQDPDGAYAAVIPKWISAMMKGETIYINGDGETSRDFCYVDNVVQANLLAAATENPDAPDQVYNIAIGQRTTLNELFALLKTEITAAGIPVRDLKPLYRDFRAADVRHSLADIFKAAGLLGYTPTHAVNEGLPVTVKSYVGQFAGLPA